MVSSDKNSLNMTFINFISEMSWLLQLKLTTELVNYMLFLLPKANTLTADDDILANFGNFGNDHLTV